MRQRDKSHGEGEPEPQEATLCLTVTLRGDGLEGHGFPNRWTKFYFHSNFTGTDPHSLESYAAMCVGSAMARDRWAVVRGLLPLGLDFVLRHPYYSKILEKANGLGKDVEIKLYDCSPVFGDRNDANTTDMQMTRMIWFIQSGSEAFGYPINLSRLPDGHTGDDVDEDPRPVVEVMRRLEEEGKFVGQPLLVSKEERCWPETELKEEAYRVELEDIKIDWSDHYVQDGIRFENFAK